jgi:hypothetical protein
MLEEISKGKFDFQLVRDLQSKINEKNKIIKKMKKETKKPVNLYCNRKRNMTMSGMVMGQNRRDSQNQLSQLRKSISRGNSRKSSFNLNSLNKKRNSLFMDIKLEDEETEHDDTETYEEPDIRERRESEVSSLNCSFNQGPTKTSKKPNKPYLSSISTWSTRCRTSWL